MGDSYFIISIKKVVT